MDHSRVRQLHKRIQIPSWQIWITRCFYIAAIVYGFVYIDWLQEVVDCSWDYLRKTWIFNCVYFETLWTAVVYPPILLAPYLMDRIPWFQRHKLDPTMIQPPATWGNIIQDGVVYVAPLLFLDTFMVKRYTGVGIDPAEWSKRAGHWIQETRALPYLPPTVLQIVVHLIISFILYDILFFFVHYAVHKNAKLYRYVHQYHHDHAHVHSKVTNQLHIAERITLVLSANQALRIVQAHPLTRMIFVPLFISGITENHCGFDLPWTLDKVVPFGLVGGSPAHFAHHQYGERHYQPFFTYIDKYLERSEAKAKSHKE